MGSLGFSTSLVLASLAGLFLVAVGYGQLVWLQRRGTTKGTSPDSPSSALLSWVFWGSLIGAVLCLLYAATSRVLPEQDAQLVGEDLFAVAPRPGLVSTYETRNKVVHKDDVLIRFGTRDGDEGQIGIRSRKQVLQGDLDMEKARPIEFDSALLHRLDTAKAQLQERTARQNQVLSERDSIEREAQQQRLNVNNRRFQAEQDLRPAQRELGPLKAVLETAQSELESQEALLRQGLLSKMEVARQRDKVTELEAQIAEHETHIAQLEHELKEVATQNGQVDKTYAGQTASRTKEVEEIAHDITEAQKEVAVATQLLEQDRPRASAQQNKRIQQIEVQMAECDALLSGNGKKAQVLAPFDGRVGFREPSPSSPPSDNGPLLVLYKPGSITATLHFDGPDVLSEAESDLDADLLFSAQAAGRERTVPGDVISKTVSRGETEIIVACDPPERVVRAIAMGGTVPVRIRLQQGVSKGLGFRFGLALGGVALMLVLLRAMGSRFQVRPAPAAASDSAPPPPAPWTTPVPPYGGGMDGFNPYIDPGGGAPDPWAPHGASRARARYQDAATRVPSLGPDLLTLAQAPGQQGSAMGNSQPPHARAAIGAEEPDPHYPHRLGARLRQDVEGANVSPEVVFRAHQMIWRGGYHATALFVSGFGSGIDGRRLAQAAFALHVRTFEEPTLESLTAAARCCAAFLQVMRTVGAEHVAMIDSVRSELIVVTLTAAEGYGSSNEDALRSVKILAEA